VISVFVTFYQYSDIYGTVSSSDDAIYPISQFQTAFGSSDADSAAASITGADMLQKQQQMLASLLSLPPHS
jgi:hypothetical protein